MLRSVIQSVLTFALRIFFSRIEVEGAQRLPADRAVLFVLNHPNALVDPLILLTVSPRPVSFLAKEPLFRTPLIGVIVRAFDALPVYRAVDQADPRKNAETFSRARSVLERGGAIAIFPEGTTHSDSKLRPLKTGAARIALGAASAPGATPLAVVPAGLYYTNKGTFRSKALLVYGEPIDVCPVESDGEPSRAAVTALSEQIKTGLMDVTLNADHNDALTAVTRAQQVFSEPDDSAGALAREFALRRQFIEGYEEYERALPERLRALEQRVAAYERQVAEVGAVPDRIPVDESSPAGLQRQRLALALLALPAALGTVLNWLPYRLIGLVCNRVVAERDDTVVSTVKLFTSLVTYPLLWSALSVVAGIRYGIGAAAATALLCPITAWCAVQFDERWTRLREIVVPLALRRRDPAAFEWLRGERRAIQEEIAALGEALDTALDADR